MGNRSKDSLFLSLSLFLSQSSGEGWEDYFFVGKGLLDFPVYTVYGQDFHQFTKYRAGNFVLFLSTNIFTFYSNIASEQIYNVLGVF